MPPPPDFPIWLHGTFFHRDGWYKLYESQPSTVNNLYEEINRYCRLLTADIFPNLKEDTQARLYHYVQVMAFSFNIWWSELFFIVSSSSSTRNTILKKCNRNYKNNGKIK